MRLFEDERGGWGRREEERSNFARERIKNLRRLQLRHQRSKQCNTRRSLSNKRYQEAKYLIE